MGGTSPVVYITGTIYLSVHLSILLSIYTSIHVAILLSKHFFTYLIHLVEAVHGLDMGSSLYMVRSYLSIYLSIYLYIQQFIRIKTTFQFAQFLFIHTLLSCIYIYISIYVSRESRLTVQRRTSTVPPTPSSKIACRLVLNCTLITVHSTHLKCEWGTDRGDAVEVCTV